MPNNLKIAPIDVKVIFTLVGDSLSAGLKVNLIDDPNHWYDFNQHKGPEYLGLAEILEKKIRLFEPELLRRLNQTAVLKQSIADFIICQHGFNRSGLTLANYNLGLDPIFVPYQMHGQAITQILTGAKESDVLIIALGGNDTQDFNTVAIEILLTKLTPAHFEMLLNKISIDQENTLKERLIEGYKHLHSGIPFASLMPNIIFSREENHLIRDAAECCKEFDDVIKKYLRDWQTKQFWTKTSLEIKESLIQLVKNFKENQNISNRKYPLSIRIILPPIWTEKSPFPSFHMICERIVEIREVLQTFAAENEIQVYDLENIHQSFKSTGKPAFGSDNLHFTKELYLQVEKEFPFEEMIKSVIETRLSAYIDVAFKHNAMALTTAKQELETILSTSFISQNKVAAFKSHLSAMQSLLVAATPEQQMVMTQLLQQMTTSLAATKPSDTEASLTISATVLTENQDISLFNHKVDDSKSDTSIKSVTYGAKN